MRGDKKSPQAICSLRRRGWGGRIRQGKPCRLQQFICPFCFAKDGLIGSNPAERLNKKNNRHSFVSVIFWLGWQDSNLRMQQSKCCVLPLDDTPICNLIRKTPPKRLCASAEFPMGWNIGFEPMVSSATNWRFNQLS